LVAQKSLGLDINGLPEKVILDKVLALTKSLQATSDKLAESISKINSIADELEQADYANNEIIAVMENVRILVDEYVFFIFLDFLILV
jgi:hypothetical protein